MASELWGYKKAPRLPPTVVISSDDDDDDDPLDMLPASKRKRLLLARNTANTPINLDSDDEEAKGSQESDEVTVVEPPASTAGPSEFDILSSKPARRKLVVDPGTQKMLDNNRRAMEELERAGELLSDDEAPEEQSQQQPTQQQQPAQQADEDVPKVLLVCRTQRQGDVKLRLRPGDPLSKLFTVFRASAVKKGWIAGGAELRFEFDGDHLSGGETPADLGMEDDDAIEVNFT